MTMSWDQLRVPKGFIINDLQKYNFWVSFWSYFVIFDTSGPQRSTAQILPVAQIITRRNNSHWLFQGSKTPYDPIRFEAIGTSY